jgi:hypothetical protein
LCIYTHVLANTMALYDSLFGYNVDVIDGFVSRISRCSFSYRCVGRLVFGLGLGIFGLFRFESVRIALSISQINSLFKKSTQSIHAFTIAILIKFRFNQALIHFMVT